MTPSTTELDLNLRLPNLCVIAHAVQGDALARVITANLYDGSTPWTPPEGAIGVIKFSTALGTSGMYDTDEDGNTAVTWDGNVATLRIVQNAIAVPGDVPMQLKFYDGDEALSTFRWECLVEPSTMTDTQFLQTDYYNILSQQIAAILEVQATIPTPETDNPLMDGTASAGSHTTYARGDHRHPTDTSRAPTNHAKNDTTYGAASTSNYGHVKLSNTTPIADGTAAVGDSTDVARANHVHPLSSLAALGLGYATCSTAESTTAKEATLAGFNLREGAMPTIKFTYAVPANSKLNINGTGSKSIYVSAAGMLTAISADIIKAGDYVTFLYNGSQYVVQSIFRQVREISKYGNIVSFSVSEVTT